LGLFMSTSPQLFEEARAALASGDLEALGARMHRLKGSAGAIGAQRSSALAARIMDAAKEGGPQSRQALTGLIADLEEELAALDAALRGYLNRSRG
jgi:HPt (histidine-containing phosphotransfer) domain-containing protein